jgi:hypothetical protein
VATLNSFYAQAGTVGDNQRRRWSVGAAYRLKEYVDFGFTYSAARALVLAAPQYATGLAGAGLDDDYALIDGTSGSGGPLNAASSLLATTSLAVGGLA